ncbi:MAG TPA: FAD-dependent oxidoreductase [Xanthobacteraceae bacterium]|nr:FAD-dependent oxidoreductase [Xanthobacteraceae bacterium]
MARSTLVVIGQGAAGVAAALAAAEAARDRNQDIDIALIDKASAREAGGNTRWSPSYMRMAAPDRVEPSFVRGMMQATRGAGDEGYFARLAQEAPATVAWLGTHGVKFHQPTYYLAKGPPRIQPVGGGPALLAALVEAAKRAGVAFRYGCAGQSLLREGGRIAGVALAGGETIRADAVVLASGGFAGNGAEMRAHFGTGAESMRLISPGTRYGTGDGIRMARALGADPSGDWNGMHAEPVDARAKNSAPVVLVYPYGIVVDRAGRRFFDEGAGLVHETWEHFARYIHFAAPGGIVFAILDSRLFAIDGYERAIRSEVPPVQAGTIEELAEKLGLDGKTLAATVADYNRACRGDETAFDPTRRDGLAAAPTLTPPKSNWARAIVQPPFVAFPLMGAVAYTFGGLATDTRARVLCAGAPIPGLYAAGEITGHFFHTAPNAVAVLRALVFGRIAGREAVEFLQR